MLSVHSNQGLRSLSLAEFHLYQGVSTLFFWKQDTQVWYDGTGRLRYGLISPIITMKEADGEAQYLQVQMLK